MNTVANTKNSYSAPSLYKDTSNEFKQSGLTSLGSIPSLHSYGQSAFTHALVVY
jgi:hypothetical protein